MLDKRTSFLLKKIDELCDDGKYKIVDESDLLSFFPAEYGVTRDSLKEMLSFLRSHEYINVKYSDRGMFCLCPLPSGRIYVEKDKERKREDQRKYLLPCCLSFLGGFVGSFLSALLLLFVFKLLGALC